MTRMGPHVNTPHRAGIAADYIRRVQPDAVKVLSSGMDGQVIAAAKEVGALIIGRLYWDDQRLGAAYGDFTRRVIAFAQSHPEIGWLEGANEFAQSPGELERYAEHEIERMKALDAIGRKAVIGNFSTGQPDLAQWSRFRPALEYAAAHGHALGLHSYSGPVMQWMVGDNQVTKFGPNGEMLEWDLEDPCEGPGVEGWLTLRYRKALKQFRAWGIGHIKIAITESGIDDVQPRPGPQGKGWKSYLGTEYANMAPFGDYADQLAWYARRLTEDANIIGWVDFGFSQAGDWSTFDLSDSPVMRERVITAMQAIPRGHPNTTPTPPPPPEAPMLQGIDVSHWQGTMDWRKAADAGAVYAWLKASDGSTYVDPEYARNATGARDAGLLHGPYHYFRNSIDPILQADHFARVVKSGPEPTLPPALDFEDTTGEVNAVNMRRFVERVNALLGRPIIYTGAWFWTPARLGGTQEWAKLFPLWIADYDGTVAIPSDWRDWTVHQYTSSGDGIAFGADSARIDRNRYRGTREELAALRIPPPAPPSSIDLAKLWAQAAANQAIRLNPAAGLQRAILAAGMEVVSNEWDYDEAHVAQLAQPAAAGSKQACFVYDKASGRIARHNQP